MMRALASWVLLAGAWACAAPEPSAPENAAFLGQLAPALSLEWLDGSPESQLADLRGKVVLLEFWRTWCPPCRREIPYLNELHTRYSADGLSVVALSNEEVALIRATAQEAGISYPLARSQGDEAERAWGITAVPRAFLIDRDGALVWVGHPGTLEEGRLRELLFGP